MCALTRVVEAMSANIQGTMGLQDLFTCVLMRGGLSASMHARQSSRGLPEGLRQASG